MSENNNFMTTLTKNPLITGIVIVVIIGVLFLVLRKSSEEAFSPPETNNIVENFPQSTPMNVMYSDANGNLGTTTDLGLQNLTVNGPMQANNRLNFVSTNGSKGISLDSSDTHLRFRSGTDDNQQFVVHSGELPQYSRTGISVGKWDTTDASINANKNINTDAQVNTMGRKNYPAGWGGGVRTFDLYGSGTLGWGNDDANLSTTIGGGNIWTAGTAQIGNLGTYNGGDGANWGAQNGGLSSWWGIGLKNTLPASSGTNGNNDRSGTVAANKGVSHYFDTRWGHTNMVGDLNAGGSLSTGNGIINMKNGWRMIITDDGHFRIQHNGADKLALHTGDLPAHVPHGMDVGKWVGKGGGTINATGLTLQEKDTDNKFTLKPTARGEGYQYGGQNLGIYNKHNAPIVRFHQGGWGTSMDAGTESVDFFKRQDGPANNPNSGDVRSYQRMLNSMWSAGGGGCGTGWPHAGCNMPNHGKFG